MSMKKNLKKSLTIGLAIIMTLSFSMLAFASDGSAPLGDSNMWFTIHVDGNSAYAGISTNITSYLSIDGEANYYSVWDDDSHTTYLYGGADETSDYSVSTYRDGAEMYYAGATFTAYANDGGYNSVFLNCSN